MKNKNHKKRGTTLIEALTILFIFSLITISFYSTFSLGMKHIQDSKNRLLATSIINEKIEIARNLHYDKVGIAGSSPEAVLLADEELALGGKRFHIHRVVDQIDDDFDNLYPTDTIPNDYKKLTITVSWPNGISGNSEVTAISRFVPPGLETIGSEDGVLSIKVFSDQPGGSGISGSSVHIVNGETGLDEWRTTDSSGNVILVGEDIDESFQKYEITVTKSDHETVATMPPYPGTSYNPLYKHASVTASGVNEVNIVQNELANLKISTVDYLDQPVSDVDFKLIGGKILGHEILPPENPVYNFNSDLSTDSGGEEIISSISPGNYFFFLLDPALSDYEIVSVSPDSWPLTLMSADGTLEVEIKLASNSFTSLLVEVLDNSDNLPISGSSVRLTNGLGYDQTVLADSRGKAFFPVTADVFSAGSYHIDADADGFTMKGTDVTIVSGELKKETIKLEHE